MPAWIDFKELRAKLRFEQVLRYYRIEVARKGEQHQGRCPLPSHGGRNDAPSFSANLERGIFHCFGCGAKGNALEFAVLMEKVSLTDGRAFRSVAMKLQKELCPDLVSVRPWKSKDGEPKQPSQTKPSTALVNEPLDFELKGLDAGHPSLGRKKLSRQTIEHFGLGFCSRGSLKGQIAIPLRDSGGLLVGYASEDPSAVHLESSFPAKRERDGKVLAFDRSLFLYNGFRMKDPCEDLVVVGGFSSVWWLHENGFVEAVAVMGPECSKEQAELIISMVSPSGRVWVMPDQTGERLAESLLPQVASHRFVRWVKLEGGRQPVDLSAGELKTCFGV